MQNLTVGLITTPGRDSERAQVIDSIVNNFPLSNIIIFAEPGEYPDRIETDSIKRQVNEERLGCFANHANAIERLTNEENNDSEYVILTQDDFVFADTTRVSIEDFLLNGPRDFGFLGLYTSPKKSKDIFKRNRQEINFGYSSYGVCYFMKRTTLQSVMQHPFFINHLITYEKNQQVDSTIGYICSRFNLPTFYHNPSLAKHIGESTIDHYDPEQNVFFEKNTPSLIAVLLEDKTNQPNSTQLTKSTVRHQVDFFETYDAGILPPQDAYLFNIEPGILYPKDYIQHSKEYMDMIQCNVTWGCKYPNSKADLEFKINDYIPEPLYMDAVAFEPNTSTVCYNPKYFNMACLAHQGNRFKYL